ncbi:hypothetical protein [Streptomyces sp. MAR4 CNX-425]|uniref:hypothetical protein n=1 Tax=Streptomyces sp. MAR4 CNX-425 TaxID=3406343 RepID=UPI003B4FFCF8
MNRTSPPRISAAAAAAVATAVLAAGCGSQDSSGPAGDEDRRAGDGAAQLYRVRATVLANGEHGPQLCRTIATSMPPTCGGPDVVGWRWDDVRAHRQSGTTYTDPLVLVGTWDGERFTPVEKPRPADTSAPPDAPGDGAADRATPCEELKDGGGDPGGAGGRARQRVLDRAQQMPGYAGAWLDGDVVNLRFAGDGGGPDAAERELRALWDGPLCVVGAEHTEDELSRVQEQVDRDVDGMLSSAVDPVRNAVAVEVVAATPELRRELDRRFGEGTVLLSGWLRPVA